MKTPAIFDICRHGTKKQLEEFLQLNGKEAIHSIDWFGNTTIICASAHKNFDTFKFLVNNDINPYIENRDGSNAFAYMNEEMKQYFQTYSKLQKLYPNE